MLKIGRFFERIQCRFDCNGVCVSMRCSHLRYDTLAQMLTLGNIHAGSKVLVFETCAGLVLGAIMERMGGRFSLTSCVHHPRYGSVIQMYPGGGPVRAGVECFGFPTHFHDMLHEFPICRVNALLAGTLDTSAKDPAADIAEEKHLNAAAEQEQIQPEAEQQEGGPVEERMETNTGGGGKDREKVEREKRQEAKAQERKVKLEEKRRKLAAAAALLEGRNADGLVIASQYHPCSVLLGLIKFLSPSRPFVVFSQFKETLIECYTKLKEQGGTVNLMLTDTWLRHYQVLPDRTHPLLLMSGGGGYLLSGTTVATDHSEPAAEEPAPKRQKVKDSEGRPSALSLPLTILACEVSPCGGTDPLFYLYVFFIVSLVKIPIFLAALFLRLCPAVLSKLFGTLVFPLVVPAGPPVPFISFCVNVPVFLAPFFVGLVSGFFQNLLVTFVSPLGMPARSPVPLLSPSIKIPVFLAAVFLLIALLSPLVESASLPAPLVNVPRFLAAVFISLTLGWFVAAPVELYLVMIAMCGFPYALFPLLLVLQPLVCIPVLLTAFLRWLSPVFLIPFTFPLVVPARPPVPLLSFFTFSVLFFFVVGPPFKASPTLLTAVVIFLSSFALPLVESSWPPAAPLLSYFFPLIPIPLLYQTPRFLVPLIFWGFPLFLHRFQQGLNVFDVRRLCRGGPRTRDFL
ncbi:hypothetical protein CCH79_00000173, partial [Gambusia affinis]